MLVGDRGHLRAPSEASDEGRLLLGGSQRSETATARVITRIPANPPRPGRLCVVHDQALTIRGQRVVALGQVRTGGLVHSQRSSDRTFECP